MAAVWDVPGEEGLIDTTSLRGRLSRLLPFLQYFTLPPLYDKSPIGILDSYRILTKV